MNSKIYLGKIFVKHLQFGHCERKPKLNNFSELSLKSVIPDRAELELFREEECPCAMFGANWFVLLISLEIKSYAWYI